MQTLAMQQICKNICLITGGYEGKKVWHYLLVSPLKFPLLKRQKVDIDLTLYGKIIASGWGDPPKDDSFILAKLNEYNI